MTILRLAGFLLLVWLGGFALFATGLPGAADERRTDGIVVLTGSAGRIERGVTLLGDRRAKRLFISGVGPDTGRLSVARTYGISAATMRCCVELGHEAVDTRSNAMETARWIARRGYRTIRFITADWHMARARYELGRQLPPGVEILEDAVPTQPSLRMLWREYHKYLFRRTSGLFGI